MTATPPTSFARLLELLTVVIRLGLIDLVADLTRASLDRSLLPGAVHDGGVVLGHHDLLGGAELVHAHVLELHAEVFAHHLTAGQGGDVLEHRLATIAKARRLDRSHLQRAAQAVEHQRRKRFTVHIFSDDQQRAARRL